jgi:hypothetical protein
VPGAILAGRYRVVGSLGRGGMGEVYRADDLRLGQPVALKFLPESIASDPTRLAQFHQEVRTARQVSHPNVCRVYDIGEVEGLTFLSMEYVDGEDLATLFRRIGRLSLRQGARPKLSGKVRPRGGDLQPFFQQSACIRPAETAARSRVDSVVQRCRPDSECFGNRGVKLMSDRIGINARDSQQVGLTRGESWQSSPSISSRASSSATGHLVFESTG